MTWATHLRDWRYVSDFGRRRISAERRLIRNSSGVGTRACAPPPCRGRAARARPSRRPGGGCTSARSAAPRRCTSLEQPRVVDLEHVDLRQVAVQRHGVGDGVAAVEGVREEDEAALGPDGGDRVVEAEAARDLLAQEEPDHLALALRLHLLARDDGQAAAARELDRLLRSAEHVVVGDRDRSEPDLLGVRRAGRRPGRCSRGTTTCACAGRPRSTPIGQRVAVDVDPRRRPARRRYSRSSSALRPRRNRRAGVPPRPSVAASSASRSLPLAGAGRNSLAAFEEGGASVRWTVWVRTWNGPRRRSGTYGLPARALSRSEHDLPAVSFVEAAESRPAQLRARPGRLDDDAPLLPARAEEPRSTPGEITV